MYTTDLDKIKRKYPEMYNHIYLFEIVFKCKMKYTYRDIEGGWDLCFNTNEPLDDERFALEFQDNPSIKSLEEDTTAFECSEFNPNDNEYHAYINPRNEF